MYTASFAIGVEFHVRLQKKLRTQHCVGIDWRKNSPFSLHTKIRLQNLASNCAVKYFLKRTDFQKVTKTDKGLNFKALIHFEKVDKAFKITHLRWSHPIYISPTCFFTGNAAAELYWLFFLSMFVVTMTVFGRTSLCY